MPRGRPEIGDFRDHENLRFSNDLPPRVKAVERSTKPRVVLQIQSETHKDGLKTLIQRSLRQFGDATPLKTHIFGVMRRELSGGVEPPTLTDAPGVRVLIPADPPWEGRGELHSPASIRLFLDGTDKTAKPRSLSPRDFTRCHDPARIQATACTTGRLQIVTPRRKPTLPTVHPGLERVRGTASIDATHLITIRLSKWASTPRGSV